MKNTKEHCYLVAKKYQLYKDFRTKDQSVYVTAFKNGWLEDYTWLIKDDRIKWNELTIYEEAKKYSTLTEFRTSVEKAYRKAKENGWLAQYTWLQETSQDETKPIWCVYVYEINNTYAYIGLTMDIKRRDYEHCCRDKKDQLAKFCKEHDIILQRNSYIIIKENIDAKEAQILEDSTKTKYIQEGKFIVLNQGSTGEGSSSLGSGIRKWDEGSCLEAAKQCKTRKEYKTKFPRAYTNSLSNKWIDNYNWFISGKCKSVVQYTLDGLLIKVYFNGAKEAELETGISKDQINSVANPNNTRNKTAKGFIWKYLKDIQDEFGNAPQQLYEKVD